ncbi:hypothetical protein D3C78_672210 [compost metagenome]
MSNIIPFPRNDLKHLSKEYLLETLEAAIMATDCYEFVIGKIASVFEACERAKIGQPLDWLAVTLAVREVECCITASDRDPRVIGLCRRALRDAGIGDSEIRISPEGEVESRKVYFARNAQGLIKIGSSLAVDGRLDTLGKAAGEELELLLVQRGSLALEKMLHEHFADLREQGEWFRAGPELEDYIESLRATLGDDAP